MIAKYLIGIFDDLIFKLIYLLLHNDFSITSLFFNLSKIVLKITKFGQDWTENKKKLSVCKILAGTLLKLGRLTPVLPVCNYFSPLDLFWPDICLNFSIFFSILDISNFAIEC